MFGFGRHKAVTDERTGEKMPDGTVYAGVSPDTHRPLYTTPTDAPLEMQWGQAMNYAAGLQAHGHNDWRVPTRGELNVLFNNRATIGGFDVSSPTGWYWSSTKFSPSLAWTQRFSEGNLNLPRAYESLSLRCVRG
jgi:hypothetical protein